MLQLSSRVVNISIVYRESNNEFFIFSEYVHRSILVGKCGRIIDNCNSSVYHDLCCTSRLHLLANIMALNINVQPQLLLSKRQYSALSSIDCIHFSSKISILLVSPILGRIKRKHVILRTSLFCFLIRVQMANFNMIHYQIIAFVLGIPSLVSLFNFVIMTLLSLIWVA